MDAYQLAFHWVRRRLLDEPGAELTTHQLHCASGVPARTCRQVLIDLARSGFLIVAGTDTFARPARHAKGHTGAGAAHGGS